MKKTTSLLLALCLCLCAFVIPTRAEWIEAEHTRSTGSPYYIMVNRRMNTLTVYTLDEDGYYTRPFMAMICSTGRQGHATPLGTFSISGKSDWTYMVDGSFGQYCSRFKGSYLIHSVCYARHDPASLLTDEYNLLGSFASLGCVRLQVADAKWVFDNCPAGTRVTIYDGDDPGALGKPERFVDVITPELDNGWDPTDPREENPWRERCVRSVTLDRTELSLEAGDKAALSLRAEPEDAFLPRETEWSSADPSIAIVNAAGEVFGAGSGVTEITARRGGAAATCAVTVTGERLPFDDVPLGEWYYRDVRYACEHRLLSGVSESEFAPDAPVSAAMMARALRNLSGTAEDAASGEWYEGALRWAAEAGLIRVDPDAAPDAERSVTRGEFAAALYAYSRMEAETAAQDAPDGDEAEQAASEQAAADAPAGRGAETALAWAVEHGLLRGTEERGMAADEVLTRAQLAAMLRRLHESMAQN